VSYSPLGWAAVKSRIDFEQISEQQHPFNDKAQPSLRGCQTQIFGLCKEKHVTAQRPYLKDNLDRTYL
jgi:hypothetical protein